MRASISNILGVCYKRPEEVKKFVIDAYPNPALNSYM